MKCFYVIVVVFLAMLNTGCLQSQLRHDHVYQARTLTEIYEQQVLDNLAMFRSNPNATPFFAIPSSGSADVTDSGQIKASPLNGPLHTALELSSLSRTNRGGWTIKPIVEPDRLNLMKCAYRRAVGISFDEDPCLNCCKRMQDWAGKAETDPCECCSCCAIKPIKVKSCPKIFFPRKCAKIGCYCGTKIEVCPQSYQEFSHLVMTILEYAINEKGKKKEKPEAEVTHFHYLKDDSGQLLLDSEGRPIVDFVDRFTAEAHPFKFKDDEGNTLEAMPIPSSGGGTSSTLDATQDILKEADRQRQRNLLFQPF